MAGYQPYQPLIGCGLHKNILTHFRSPRPGPCLGVDQRAVGGLSQSPCLFVRVPLCACPCLLGPVRYYPVVEVSVALQANRSPVTPRSAGAREGPEGRRNCCSTHPTARTTSVIGGRGPASHLWAAPAGKWLVPRLAPQCRAFFGRTRLPGAILPFGPELFVSSVLT